MITYQKTSTGDSHCVRIGSQTSGIQICFGSFSGVRPCSVSLNNTSSIYTGVAKNTDTDNILPAFPATFQEAPLVMAMPQAGDYWFGDVLANTSTLSRLDFYSNKKRISSDNYMVKGNYLAIGKFGNTDVNTINNALNGLHAYWDGDTTIRIQTNNADAPAIQITSGNLSNSSSSTAINTTLHCAHIGMADNKAFPHAFSETPRVLVSPSMKCRDWDDDDKFPHPYWFGGVTATSSKITRLDAYSNAERSNKTIYGRYIAVGISDEAPTNWTEVDISLTQGENGGYSLRFGNSAKGMQLAFGEIHFTDRKIQKLLNSNTSVTSNIYTAYKEAPAYSTEEPMYFAQAFCESPSTILMAARECRTKVGEQTKFRHPYWFGDAASDAVSVFSLDMYTNKQFTTDQDVYAKYLAAGKYNAKSDWARDFILNALSYKHKTSINGTAIGEYFLNRYETLFGKEQSDVGWCSEFASVTLHDGKAGDGKSYPHKISVRLFVSDFSTNNEFYMARETQNTQNTVEFVPAVLDDPFNPDSDYTFGGIRNTDNKNFRFSCTVVPGEPAKPEMGDLIFFDNSPACHTGIVINVNGSYIFTVEGNVRDRRNPNSEHLVRHKRRKITAQKDDDDTMIGIGNVYGIVMNPEP